MAGLRWADRHLLTSKLHDNFTLIRADSPLSRVNRRTEKGLMVDCPGILVFMDIDELPAQPLRFFVYNKRMSRWIKFSPDRMFQGPAMPRLEGLFAILIQDHRLVLTPTIARDSRLE